jgi:hypothetical protein
VQGEELLWSTSDAALRVAIMETIRHLSLPLAASASPAPPPGKQHNSDDELRKLLLCNPDATRGNENDKEDFS